MLKVISSSSEKVTMSTDDTGPVQWEVTYDDKEIKELRITGRTIEFIYKEEVQTK